jgi:hypothetical protein
MGAVRFVFIGLTLVLLAAACAPDQSESSLASPTADGPGPVELARPDPDSVYNPVFEGEEVPVGFRQLLGRDDIFPVYDPIFVAADQVDWPEDGLVVGVDLDGEARAYPVGFLDRREMVIDNHRGIPTLVTW